MASSECEDETLPVTCGNQTGLLHMRLFLCPGIHQECIQVKDALVTPKMFSVMGDKEKLKDWKNAIRIHGVSVRKMMDTGDLNYYKHKELCSGKCVSRNLGGSKYDISRFEREHELPAFTPFLHTMDLCKKTDLDVSSQPVFPSAMAEGSPSASPPSPTEYSSPDITKTTNSKLCGAAKRKCKKYKKDVKKETGMDTPSESLDSLASSPSTHSESSQDHGAVSSSPASLGLMQEPHDICTLVQSPPIDTLTQSHMVAKALVAKTLADKSYLNGQNGLNGLNPFLNGFTPVLNGFPFLNGINPLMSSLTPVMNSFTPMRAEDYLISLDLKEDSQAFWQGIVELGMINEFFREIKNSLDVLKNDIIKGKAQYEDTQKASNIVTELGLMTKLRWKLAAKRSDDKQKEQLPADMEDFKKKMQAMVEKHQELSKQRESLEQLLRLGIQRTDITGGMLRSMMFETASSGSHCSDSEVTEDSPVNGLQREDVEYVTNDESLKISENGEEPQDLSCRKRPHDDKKSDTAEVQVKATETSDSKVKVNGHGGEGQPRSRKRRKNVAHRVIHVKEPDDAESS